MSADLPVWIQTGLTAAQTGMTALALTLPKRRHERALKWLAEVEALANMTPAELAQRIEDSPEVEELVWTALEVAARTAGDRKREALACAAAVALAGNVAAIDEHLLLVRTVANLDEIHVQVLARLAVKKPPMAVIAHIGPPTDQISLTELAAEWEGSGYLVEPIVATLEREGVLVLVDVGDKRQIPDPIVPMKSDTQRWKVTEYGQHLLAFLRPSAN